MKNFLKQNWFEIVIVSCLLFVVYSIAAYFIFFLSNKENPIQVEQAGGEIKEQRIQTTKPVLI